MPELFDITVDITVDMSAAPAHVTHVIDPGELDLQPVTQFTAPAEGHSHTVSFGGPALEFSWAMPVSSTDFPPKFEVVFYAMEEGELVPFTANTVQADGSGFLTTASVPQATLEELAKNAGIPQGETGRVYWTVRTIMLKESALAEAEPRELVITRVQGLPDELYISGSATEWSALAGARKMKKVDDGVFEIYTSMTRNSTYLLTNGTGSDAVAYSGTGLSPVAPSAGEIASPNTNSSSIPYRMTVNFNSQQITAQPIWRVYLYQTDGDNVQIPYSGDGKWEITNHTKAAGDNRYLFRVSYTNQSPVSSASAWVESWCSVNWNNNSAPSSPTGDFWNITVLDPEQYTGGDPKDNWGHAYKWLNGNSAAAAVSIEIFMNEDTPYHYVSGL